MELKTLEALNVTVSRLGMGNMRLPTTADGKIDTPAGCALIDHLMAAGVTYYDTAYFYHGGESEVFCKAALIDRYPRDSFTLATKMPSNNTTAEQAEKVFKEQMERTGATFFDFYLLHAVDWNSYVAMKDGGALAYLESLKAEGKIRFLGFSFHGAHDGVEKILSDYSFDFCQLQLNYFDWDKGHKEEYEAAVRHNVPVVVMEPVRGGLLAQMRPDIQTLFTQVDPKASIASWALRWVAELPSVAVILSGMSDEAQVLDNIATFTDRKPMTEAEKAMLATVMERMDQLPLSPCTNCRYCIECPKSIPIPGIFGNYNNYLRFDNISPLTRNYLVWTPKEKQADACIQCGYCESKCPQQIKIMEELAKIHALALKG